MGRWGDSPCGFLIESVSGQAAAGDSERRALKRFFQSEAGAAVLWVVAALVIAAAITPWIYQAGKGLAVVAEAGNASAFTEWLGGAAGRAKFGRFFSRALVFSALMLLPLLFWRIRVIRASSGLAGVPMVRMRSGMALAQVIVGFVIAAGFLWGLGMVIEALGAYVAKADPPETGKLLKKTLIPAVVAPLLEEWLFRGLILGLWLRFARPLWASVGTSLFFAFVHFLNPPESSSLGDPTAALAGFELLGKILLHFTDPRFFVTDFATLFSIGMILAWARLRTGALWFSIGLHAGWIAAFKGFNLLHKTVADHPLRPWWVGEDLRSGVLPLLTLVITAGVCHIALKALETGKPALTRALR
jgi:membrane protease YdiL (CAAX protease family)